MKALNSINLGAFLLLICLTLVRWLPPYMQSRYTPPVPDENWTTLTLKDPHVGSVLPLNGPVRQNVIILVVGDCGPCNATKVLNFSNVKLPPGIGKAVLVASDDTLEAIRKEFGQPHDIPLGKMTNEQRSFWNASFLPRVYAVNANGILTYVQSPSVSYGQGFVYAVDSLTGGAHG